MTPEMQRLQDEVNETKQVEQSAATLIGGLAQQLRDNATDPAAINALADDLDASANALAAAVAANTPAATPPATPPTV